MSLVNTPNNMIERKRLQGELMFMKDLFDKLPTGENTQEIESYFNYLQSIIDNTDNEKDGPTITDICRDEFEEDVDGRDYRYISSAHFEQRASTGNKISNRQSISDAPALEIGGCVSSQTHSEVLSDSTCIQKPT